VADNRAANPALDDYLSRRPVPTWEETRLEVARLLAAALRLMADDDMRSLLTKEQSDALGEIYRHTMRASGAAGIHIPSTTEPRRAP
jgi:hypothetical protein